MVRTVGTWAWGVSGLDGKTYWLVCACVCTRARARVCAFVVGLFATLPRYP